MNTIHIVYPVLRGKRRFKIEKGRRWSVIEHLLLQAVSDEGRSAGELAKLASMPQRIIVEAFTRLMRVGWVEIEATRAGTLFKATPIGAVYARQDELPSATTPDNKWRSFFIDESTGAVFRIRDIVSRSRKDLPTTNDEQFVYEIPRKGLESEDLGEIFSTIENADEVVVGVYPSAERLIHTFGLVTFRNGIPEGHPKRASSEFTLLIDNAYKSALAEIGDRHPKPTSAKVASAVAVKNEESYLFDPNDIITDGKRNQDAFEALVKGAQDRLIIHSTFVSENIDQRVGLLLSAARRGVLIDILFGQEERADGLSASEAALAKLREALAPTGLKELFRIHPFSTGSHAKIVIGDDRKLGWVALVGSCNWLATSFVSFDASLRIRDNRLVGQLLNLLSRMSHSRLGIWNEAAADFAVLSRKILSEPTRQGRKARMSILRTGDHAELAMRAARESKNRVFVLSHQLGLAGQPVCITPLLQAIDERGIEVSAFYGKTAGSVTGLEAASFSWTYAKRGFELCPIERPRLHAKALGWDTDHLAITSFNWLSVDPNVSKPLREIGVHVESTRAADTFWSDFNVARWD